MIPKRLNIYYSLCKVPILLMYGLFFTVQLFFNFDTTGKINSNKHVANSVHHSNQYSSLKIAGQHKLKSNTRLNKRFEPAAISLYNPFFITTPVCLIINKQMGTYQNPFFFSSYFFIRGLRGPPIAA